MPATGGVVPRKLTKVLLHAGRAQECLRKHRRRGAFEAPSAIEHCDHVARRVGAAVSSPFLAVATDAPFTRRLNRFSRRVNALSTLSSARTTRWNSSPSINLGRGAHARDGPARRRRAPAHDAVCTAGRSELRLMSQDTQRLAPIKPPASCPRPPRRRSPRPATTSLPPTRAAAFIAVLHSVAL